MLRSCPSRLTPPPLLATPTPQLANGERCLAGLSQCITHRQFDCCILFLLWKLSFGQVYQHVRERNNLKIIHTPKSATQVIPCSIIPQTATVVLPK